MDQLRISNDFLFKTEIFWSLLEEQGSIIPAYQKKKKGSIIPSSV